MLSKEAGQSADQTIDEMSRLFILSRAIHVVAELGLADHVGDEPISPDDLAEETGTNAAALTRLLIFLSAYGVFQEIPAGKFSHTELSSVFRTDHPNSVRTRIQRVGAIMWSPFGGMEHTIRTGESAFNHVHGASFFQYLKENSGLQKPFDEGMAQKSDIDDTAIAAAYNFNQFNCVVDVAGGRGGLLTQILLIAPDVKGILFEQPQVIDQATLPEERGLSERIKLVGGNIFESVVGGGDCYVIKGVLHDFDDEQCVTILSNCRKVMDADGRLVISNQDLPSPIDGPHPNLTMDILMMAMLSGRERSEPEWSELFHRSGLKFVSSIQTDVGFTLIEGMAN
jgi:C-methyltransferase